MKKILLALFIITLIGLVSAQTETVGPYEKDTCYIIKQTCGNCTYVNLSSIEYPNGSIGLTNVALTYQGNTEYQYNCLNLNQRGRFIVNGYGDIDGVKTPFSYDILVGSSIWLWLTIICLAGFFLIMSIFGNTEFFLFISGCLFILSGIFGMIYGISTFNEIYTRGISFVSIGIGILLLVGSYLDFGSFGGNSQEDED